MQLLLHLRDVKGKTILHSLGSSSKPLLGLSKALMDRAFQLDPALYQQFMATPDIESGYTPLHWAVLEANLTAILLFLRGPEPRLTQRPMDVLVHEPAIDAERLTPIALLGRLSKPLLKACRESLPKPQLMVMASSTKHGREHHHHQQQRQQQNQRSSSFDTFLLEPEDEFADLSHAMQQGLINPVFDMMDCTFTQLQQLQQQRQHACEVLTFGRAHHCALGVSDANASSRPCRVVEFALAQRHILASAVMVAAAAHHSLVVTRNGHLYAFGLNKNGRLGTGQDQHVPLPIRISSGGLHKKHVTYVAAAENHSLAVTNDGTVHGWGSNRFGQLGGKGEANRPRRLEELKHVTVVAVAAGDKHSVALTLDGQVYTWGDNGSGQLGYCKANGVQRVDGLWKSQRVAMAIAASEQSTLVLCLPSGMGLPVNAVYSWGHGNYVPSRVNFDTTKAEQHARRNVINPIAITCAKYHSAAITDDGRVYCWGLHAESIGTLPKTKSHQHVSSPQLVTGMLPQNGGGIAVAVSASEHHTAVVTDQGHLFTWGAHTQPNVLGHEGVRFQPTPKQVPGVYRAVGVASAKEHTLLLVGTSFPTLPSHGVTLESMAARTVAQHVDLFNVIPIWIMAERTQCHVLVKYCKEFVKYNMDGVLTLGRKSEMDLFLNEQLADARLCKDRDTNVHPLMYDVVTAGDHQTPWRQACNDVLAHLPISALVRYREQKARVGRGRGLSFHDQREHDELIRDRNLQTDFRGCSDRCLKLTTNVASLVTHEEIRSKYECLSKEIRGTRKRLAQTSKLQTKDTLTSVEREKLARRPLMEADLAALEPALERVTRLMAERNMDLTKEVSIESSSVEVLETKQVKIIEEVTEEEPTPPKLFNCELCGVSCPDSTHLDLHTNGRKHRNRVLQVQEEEEKKAAATLMEEKRKQSFKSDPVPITTAVASKKSSPWAKTAIEPRYTLPPPPLGVGPLKTPVKSTPKPVGVSPNFRSILAEEEKKRSTPAKSKVVPKPKTQFLLSPGKIPVLHNAPWANAPTVRVPAVTTKTPPTQVRSMSLGEFLAPPPPQAGLRPSSVAAAPWAASAVVAVSPQQHPVAIMSPSPPGPPKQGKSLLQIQQEEADFQSRNKSKVDVKEGKWFIQRTERAASFSAIQEADARDREMELLIEEQKEIEAQIARENSKTQREQKKKPLTRRKQPPVDERGQPRNSTNAHHHHHHPLKKHPKTSTGNQSANVSNAPPVLFNAM